MKFRPLTHEQIAKVHAYRAEHECSLQEAFKAVLRQERLSAIEELEREFDRLYSYVDHHAFSGAAFNREIVKLMQRMLKLLKEEA